MHSFTSNSSDRLPHFNFRKVFALAVLLVITFVSSWNVFWTSAGFPYGLLDNGELWSYHRRQASLAGERAIVFIGSSRMQAGIDLKEVQKQTGNIPIQLAAPRMSSMYVLENLAEDESFKGTVVAEITEQLLFSQMDNKGEVRTREYEENRYGNGYTVPLKSFVKNLIVSPNLGSSTSEVFKNIFTKEIFDRNYLERFLSLSIYRIDFNRSAQGYLDNKPQWQLEKIMQAATREINQSNDKSPPNKMKFNMAAQQIETYIKRIQARGGKVILINFPLGGAVKELNEKYFPKKDFWDELVKISSAKTIYYADYPELASIETLDGTHFSGQDATLFTRELLKIISN